MKKLLKLRHVINTISNLIYFYFFIDIVKKITYYNHKNFILKPI